MLRQSRTSVGVVGSMQRRRRKKNVAPPPPSNEILLGRAKQHMRFKEWERAVDCLDDILREPKDHPVGSEFMPDKEGLLTRGRVKLILCRNSGAFEDAMLALKGIDADAAAGSAASSGDPVYPRAMSLKAAALYQMGRYEHALLNYHRADRSKSTYESQMGIKQATEAILGCMRSAVQREDKFRIDVQVDDATSSSPAGAVVSRTSYVLPARAPSMTSTTSSGISRRDRADYLPVVPSSTPFQRDVRELKSIVGRIAASSRFTRQPRSCALAKEALNYASKRNSLWLKMDASRHTEKMRSTSGGSKKTSDMEEFIETRD